MRIGVEKIEQIEKDLADLRELVKNGRVETAEIMRRTHAIDQSLKLAFGQLQDSYVAHLGRFERTLSRMAFDLGERLSKEAVRDIGGPVQKMSASLNALDWRLTAIENGLVKAAKAAQAAQAAHAAQERAGIGRPADKRESARASSPVKKKAAPKPKSRKPKLNNRKKRG